jgi:hypothetical protein
MMSGEPLLPPPVLLPPSAARFVRIEYLDFRNVAEHREFRLRVCGPDGSTEFRMRIALAAFAGRIRMQDGPDVCYQRLLREVATGDSASLDPITIDDLELASYREAHTKVAKHRAGWVPSPPPVPAISPWKSRRPSVARLPVAPLVATDREPALEEGQRVSHVVFGVGVTTSSNGGHTIVRFDEGDGPRTFVTSMLKVEVLSAPRTWETTPRGKNRLRRTAAPPAASPA